MAQNVLVVDDDPLTQRVLKYYLERAGYEILAASAGREAIRIARQHLPKLIILDLMLPDIDGREVLRQMQKTKETKDIPVVLLSGNTDLATTEDSLQSGATQVLVKPINPEQLIAVLRHVLS
jgi:two-component system phosphate regulon response regulator PhoB